MIDAQTLEGIKLDFYSGPGQETLIIPPHEASLFWEWFHDNCIYFGELFSNAPPFNTHEFIAGRCFGNAQTVTINNGLDYYEGFVRRKGEYILHGFNLLDGGVLDVTALNNPEHFLGFDGEPTNHYIGVNIPFDLITQYNLNDIQAETVNINCLIYHLFSSQAN